MDGFRFDLIPAGSGVLCALSGGADSMYLLCRLLEGREKCGWTVHAAHLNHGLRPAARRDEDFVRDWCKKQNVPLHTLREHVEEYAFRNKLSVEEAGRVLRYRFLEETAWEIGDAEHPFFVATGHHAGDNAETVLMNLIRGCGLHGLTGIPERRGSVVRPMLNVTRREILAYLEERHVPHVEDETNADPAYTRNKVRLQLLPLLEELNPRAVEHIRAAAARLDEDEAELSRQAAAISGQGLEIPHGLAVNADLLREAPRPIALRACGQLLERAGLGGEAVHREGMLSLALGDDPSAAMDVPGGRVWRQYGLLALSPEQKPPPPRPMELTEGQILWGGWAISCGPAVCPEKAYLTPRNFYLKPDRYVVRPRKEGDKLTLGKRPPKTVKKLLMEARVPAGQREQVPVLDSGGRAAALGGFGPDKEFLAEPGQPALHFILKAEENEHDPSRH